MLCAFKENNTSAAKQMLLRLEESNSDAFINLTRCLCAFGIPNFLSRKNCKTHIININFILAPITSYKIYYTPYFISNHRMIAHLAQLFEHISGNTMNEQLILALHSHRDINNVIIQDLDYDTLRHFVLFPNFALNYDEFIQKLVLERSVPLHLKLRYLAFLTSVKLFMAKDRNDINENLKYCFNLLLYVRSSTHENDQSEHATDFLKLPIFHKTEDKILKAIKVLLEN